MTVLSHVRRPRTAAAAPLHPQAVAKAYNYPAATGRGATIGIIELGGGVGQSDLRTYFGANVPSVTPVNVGQGHNDPGQDPQGADGEVLLDVEVCGAVASGATLRIYFASNTDNDFAAAIGQAVTDGCDAISISWGGPENSWSSSAIAAMEAQLARADAAGVLVTVAAGDSGADDGTNRPVTDYPASSPHVLACGGTRLLVDATGARAAEATWNDDPHSSATGGGLSHVFPGRQVPDVAGNADPASGYIVLVDGRPCAIGGTSAVAPLYAGLAALLREALGRRVSRKELLAAIAAHPEVCFDVTVGDNGAYRAGPGRDQVTGFGVVDGGRLLTALRAMVPAPAPPAPIPVPVPTSAATRRWPDQDDVSTIDSYFLHGHGTKHLAAAAWSRSVPA